MFSIRQTSHTLHPFAVVHQPPKGKERIWRYFATFADADVYRQEVSQVEAQGQFCCSGCVIAFRWQSQLTRHQETCIGTDLDNGNVVQ